MEIELSVILIGLLALTLGLVAIEQELLKNEKRTCIEINKMKFLFCLVIIAHNLYYYKNKLNNEKQNHISKMVFVTGIFSYIFYSVFIISDLIYFLIKRNGIVEVIPYLIIPVLGLPLMILIIIFIIISIENKKLKPSLKE